MPFLNKDGLVNTENYLLFIKSKQSIQKIQIKKNYNISNLGKFIRKYKLDEVPKLLNILEGNMSFVGPRPDILGIDDKLDGEERIILSAKPGITGPTTLHF